MRTILTPGSVRPGVKRARVLAPVLLFVLLASAGTVWLVHVARGGAAGNPLLVEASDGPAPVRSAQTSSTAVVTHPTIPAFASATPSKAGVIARPAGAATGVPRPAARATSVIPAAPPIPVRAIRVGGVTLDDTSPRTMCYLVRNVDSPVTVRISELAAGNPDVVIRPDRCAGVTAQDVSGDWIPTVACRPGVDLEPHGDGCYTGIEPRTLSSDPDNETDLHSSFSVTLRARCSSAAGLPCSESGTPVPTAARPVDVTWTQPFTGSQLCIRNPPGDNPFC